MRALNKTIDENLYLKNGISIFDHRKDLPIKGEIKTSDPTPNAKF